MATVAPVAGALGAEVRDIDLRSDDAEVYEDLRAAIHAYQVVFIRQACLNEAEHLQLARRLGTPSVFPLARLRGETEPSFQVISDGPDSPPETDYWHTDVTWTAEPPKYALLAALVVPERGGDTLWASMTAAFDALSPVMQDLLRGLTVVHDNESFIAAVLRKIGETEGTRAMVAELRKACPPVVHPLVRTHPETGREALFLGGSFMRAIEGMTQEESDLLLGFLQRHIQDARFHCRWRWQPGDLAIWDERSTNHRSAGDHFPQHRTIRRIEVDGDRPFYRPLAPAS
jgi:taurine dioxygenase